MNVPADAPASPTPLDPEAIARATHQPLPPGFREHRSEGALSSPVGRDQLWAWLCDPDTFRRGQIPPWRVEFVAPEGGAWGGFETGTPNVHHGPGLVVAGLIGAMRRPEYRDLRYFYGSHALSLRLIRPTRLQFWLEEEGAGTRLRWRLDAQVRRGWGGLWTFVQAIFWRGFRLTVTRGARRHARRASRA